MKTKSAHKFLANSTVQSSISSISGKATAGMLKMGEGFSSYSVLKCQNLVFKSSYLEGVREHSRIFSQIQKGYIPRPKAIF